MSTWWRRRIECAQSRQAARLAALLFGVVLPWAVLIALWVRS
jgi:hypothetical protein